MSDFILDDAARRLTVGELLDRADASGLRLVTPAGTVRGEVSPAAETIVLGDMNPGPSAQPRGGGVSGDQLRARLAAIEDEAGLDPTPGLRPGDRP